VIKSRRTRWTGHVALIDDNRGVYGVLVRKSEGKGRTRRGWEDNIQRDFQEVGFGRIDWI